MPLQAAVANFIEGGHLSRHVARMRRVYRERRRHLLALLDRYARDRLHVIPSHYGMHVAAFAADGIDCERISGALARRSILIHTLRRYHLGVADRSGFIFGFASSDSPKLEQAIGALGSEMGNRCHLQDG